MLKIERYRKIVNEIAENMNPVIGPTDKTEDSTNRRLFKYIHQTTGVNKMLSFFLQQTLTIKHATSSFSHEKGKGFY